MTFTLLLATTMTFTGLVSSSPVYIPPPPGETYITGSPLCGAAGWTYATGTYVDSYYQTPNATAGVCLDACRLNATLTAAEVLAGQGKKQPDGTWGGCASVAISATLDGTCLFYDNVVEGTYLLNIPAIPSPFLHYDLLCPII